MDDAQIQLEKYKISIDLLKFEGQMLWQIMTPFMVVNGILLAFISNKVQLNFIDKHNNLACFIAGIFGIILIIPWWGTFVRNTSYYHLRMEQAKLNEPEGFDILKSVGKDFSDGKKVKIADKELRIPLFGRWMLNKRACQILIGLFAIIYFALIILYSPC